MQVPVFLHRQIKNHMKEYVVSQLTKKLIIEVSTYTVGSVGSGTDFFYKQYGTSYLRQPRNYVD